MQKVFLSILVRVKDEPFIDEFIKYYIKQGVDKIFIWDDNSTLKYSDYVLNNSKVIMNSQKLFSTPQELYEKIKFKTKWLMFIDADEFITTKRRKNKTIVQELKTTFNNCDCVKIPWILFSCNKLEKDPESLLNDLTWRWNHDLKHPHPNNFFKGRCRYNAIECKCIFKPHKFKFLNKLNDHHPTEPNCKVKCLNSINNKKSKISAYYYHLREKDIKNAWLICHHYRLISKESCERKIESNKYYTTFSIDDLLACDYCEIEDTTLKNYLN